ncbi:MAG: hypothetical protein ACHQNA_11205 [Acidimicrobiales bacterium]
MVSLRRGPVCGHSFAGSDPCRRRVGRPGQRCLDCLEQLAASADAQVRVEVAGATDLVPHLFPVLGRDGHVGVRLAVASRADCPLATLQRLEYDEDQRVRAAASGNLSDALRPRSLAPGESDPLFEDSMRLEPPVERTASVEPFGATFAPVVPGLAGPSSPGRVDMGDVLELLGTLTGRLVELETQLALTQQRLDAMATPAAGVRVERAGTAPAPSLSSGHALALRSSVLEISAAGLLQRVTDLLGSRRVRPGAVHPCHPLAWPLAVHEGAAREGGRRHRLADVRTGERHPGLWPYRPSNPDFGGRRAADLALAAWLAS